MRNGRPPTDSDANIDWFIFSAGAVGILLVSLPLMLFPEAGREALAAAFAAVTHGLGPVYLLGALGVLLFLLYLAFSRFGKVVLGKDAAPEYSSFSWAAMLFCGGIGTSVLYWGTVEWAHYYSELPFGGAPRNAGSHPLGHGLPHLPLGLHRLGALLPARRGHRLRLPCAPHTRAAPEHRLPSRLGAPHRRLGGALRGLAVHGGGARRRHHRRRFGHSDD